jgi:hypothetical protein
MKIRIENGPITAVMGLVRVTAAEACEQPSLPFDQVEPVSRGNPTSKAQATRGAEADGAADCTEGCRP